MNVSAFGCWTVATPIGDLDMASAPTLADVGASAGQCLAVDLHGVDFMDSSGMTALLVLADAHPELVLVAPSAAVVRTLELTKAVSRFCIRGTLGANSPMADSGCRSGG